MARDAEKKKLKIELYRERYRGNSVAKLYGVRIVRYKGKSAFGQREMIYENEGFTLENSVKWKWYFRYLAAKFQLETPRNAVEWYIYDYPHINENEVIKKWIMDDLRAAKSKLTQVENAIKKHEENKKDLFSASVDDVRYINTLTLLETRKQKVKELEEELRLFEESINEPTSPPIP